MSETMEAQAQDLLQLLSAHGSLGNGKAQELLAIGPEAYEALREQLVAQGLVAKGRGRGGSVQITPKGKKALVSGKGLEASEPMAAKPMATGLNASEPEAYMPVGRKAKGQEPEDPRNTGANSLANTLCKMLGWGDAKLEGDIPEVWARWRSSRIKAQELAASGVGFIPRSYLRLQDITPKEPHRAYLPNSPREMWLSSTSNVTA